MKIGVWLNKDHNPTDGGSFSFLDKLIKSIDEYHFSSKLEVVFISESDKYKGFSKEIIYLKYPKCKLSLLKKIHLRFSSIHKRIIISGKIQKKNDDLKLYYYSSILKKHNVDLIYYPRQCNCEIENYPFVATNWDIGHLSTYSFPEFDKDYDLVKRNEWFNKLIYKALYVFCESDSGRNELMKFTRLDESRLKVVPIFAGSCTSIQVSYEEQERILNNYNLSKEYFFFYPAQFWAHKNHFGLLQAFRLFVLDHPGYKLVFTGSDKGNRKYIESVTQDLSLIHISEPTRLLSISYAVFCLKKKNTIH